MGLGGKLVLRNMFLSYKKIGFSFIYTEIVIHAFVSSRLDNCSGPLAGINQMSHNRLQQEQEAAARLITKNKKGDHITPFTAVVVISYKIDFKI